MKLALRVFESKLTSNAIAFQWIVPTCADPARKTKCHVGSYDQTA
ncbi:hypothetical protein CEV33_3552 [Brucella grignonensis]|uniref:Uncharacterized protein n=1 Tax=Brucella grignonensis TaxID=94627 RepID=A0A256EZM6_9HYPH|nr:hypothetical protein CEV33_3552 [Brucella grignonensis]